MTTVIGVDFGTTNSVVAILRPDGSVRTRRFPADGTELDVFRTVLCFWSEEAGGRARLHHAAGPQGVQAYLDEPLDSRLIMSMKTYLAQRSFTQTRIFGRPFTLEQLVALFLRALLGGQPGDPPPDGLRPHDVHPGDGRPHDVRPHDAHPGDVRIVAGCPVRFAGESADDAFGVARLRGAFAEAGFPDIEVALEPEAAGYRVARTFEAATTVLVGDFGGGTSDFSVMRFDPLGGSRRVTPLGHAGIGIAGDTFDYRIIDHVVSPLLGKGDTYTVMGKALPVPPDYFSGFARWHSLSMMRTPRTVRDIAAVAAASAHPERLRALIGLIEDEMGYPLYQAVSAAKAALSRQDAATLRIAHRDFVVDRRIARAEFEAWIAGDLRRMAETVDRALANAGVAADAIDRVFLTGGTSFVPAVRALFERRFGAEKVSGGGEFVSVAEELALIGRDRVSGDAVPADT
ncbi:Hsp70 family protein [Rhodopila sp.]|uniref:Hsp70 family protein n=1 Tax=Rhodopila sp. TaxID=2480087 RepID=UPI002BB44B2E|nr:Hsp70 family protein [Rhodopila sp.]HVZ09450.1 Hsp70 family protein [Rhodopila sp.]